MKLKNLYLVTSIIFFIAGLGSLLFPEKALSNFGLILDDSGIFMARRFGAALLGFTVILWMARTSIQLQRAILTGMLVAISLNVIISLIGIITGLLSALGWLLFILGLLLAIGFIYFLFVKEAGNN